MIIWKNIKDGKLYVIYRCRPPMVLGSHYEAELYPVSNGPIKIKNLKDFVQIGER